jgi:NAD(P)H-hydrate epimerase
MQLPAPLLRKSRNVHKNTFGHVLVIGGSETMLGAGCLSALAALRSGAGLVTLAVPKALIAIAQSKVNNCIMVEDVKKAIKNKGLLDYSAVAIGPGLGREPAKVKLVQRIIKTSQVPLVIDADALFAVAHNPIILQTNHIQKVLTPHPGEMSMIAKISKIEIQDDRRKAARDFANLYDCTVLLKGHHTVVASKGKKLYINKTGNPGMATAGSGDVLTGMIAAFLAQNLSAHDAARLGAYLHGRAGDLAVTRISKASLIASDLIDFIPEAMKS